MSANMVSAMQVRTGRCMLEISARISITATNTTQVTAAGPASLYYSPGVLGTAPQEGLMQAGQPFQAQGPQGPSAAPPGWFPAAGSGKPLSLNPNPELVGSDQLHWMYNGLS